LEAERSSKVLSAHLFPASEGRGAEDETPFILQREEEARRKEEEASTTIETAQGANLQEF